jgi:hypothetical protein
MNQISPLLVVVVGGVVVGGVIYATRKNNPDNKVVPIPGRQPLPNPSSAPVPDLSSAPAPGPSNAPAPTSGTPSTTTTQGAECKRYSDFLRDQDTIIASAQERLDSTFKKVEPALVELAIAYVSWGRWPIHSNGNEIRAAMTRYVKGQVDDARAALIAAGSQAQFDSNRVGDNLMGNLDPWRESLRPFREEIARAKYQKGVASEKLKAINDTGVFC